MTLWTMTQDCTNSITFKNNDGQEITLSRDYNELTEEDLKLAEWVLAALNNARGE